MTDQTFKVSSLLSIYSQSISSSFDKEKITIEGFYKKGNGISYSNLYYADLYDEDKSHKVKIQFKNKIKEQLNDNEYYVFEGYINKSLTNLKNGSFNILFFVDKIKEQKDTHQFISKEQYNLVIERYNRPFPNIWTNLIDIIKKGEKPMVAIIQGESSIVYDDFKNQLPNDNRYIIDVFKTRLSSAQNIIETINKVSENNYDLLCVMRGGGSGLNIFEDTTLAHTALNLPIDFVTAIGHENDKTLLEKVADKGFATPSTFGTFLQYVITVFDNEIKILKESEILISKLRDEKSDTLKSIDGIRQQFQADLNKEKENFKNHAIRVQDDKEIFLANHLEKEKNIKKIFIITVSILIIIIVILSIII